MIKLLLIGLTLLSATNNLSIVLADNENNSIYNMNNLSSVMDDLENMSFNLNDISYNEDGFSFIGYVRSDNYNYLYFSTNYLISTNLYASISYLDAQKDNENLFDYSEYPLTLVNGYNDNSKYYYKFLIDNEIILSSSKVTIENIYYKRTIGSGGSKKINVILSEVNACYLYDTPTTNKVVKQAKKVSIENKIKITSSNAFDDIVSTNISFFEKMLFQVDDYYTMSYFLFNTSIDDWMDSITDITLEYTGINFKLYYDYYPEIATYLTYKGEIYSDLKTKSDLLKTEEETVSQEISLNQSDNIDLEKTHVFGYKTVYNYKQLFTQNDVSDYPYVLNKMQSDKYNHGCLFKHTKRESVYPIKLNLDDGSGSGGGGGGGSSVHSYEDLPIKAPTRNKVITYDAFCISGFSLNEVQALNIKYLKNGVSYTAEFEDNKTISSGEEKEDPSQGNQNYTTSEPDWLKNIKDIFNNSGEFIRTMSIILGALILAYLIIILLPIIKPIIKGIGYVISLPFKLIKKRKKKNESK